ncbi:DUF5655 domain-containing protein [Arthrobacter globiformis]|uniref:DUF5655 domain-containing protein n=1 Tax=Arthrobacter globiformis TaxID=1665 RepID=A0A328HKC7_ARTGO|nr:DUF5655 domain-containing protein [Arthrobacter globiformis]RAM39078.1 hypothetical protein DBZ45_01610 [Arthrobacter globiformis]
MARTARERIDGDPISSEVYEALATEISALDGCELQEKASSFHVAHGRAFLGIHPRRGGLLINIVLDRQLESARVHRAERVSANRWHNEIMLHGRREIDTELRTWINEAYAHTA